MGEDPAEGPGVRSRRQRTRRCRRLGSGGARSPSRRSGTVSDGGGAATAFGSPRPSSGCWRAFSSSATATGSTGRSPGSSVRRRASIDWLVTTVYDVGAFGVAAVLVVLALVARRWEVARDLGVSVLATGAVTGLLILVPRRRRRSRDRHRHRRLLGDLPGLPDRRVHGHRHRGVAVPGPNGPATGRARRRPRRHGVGRRRPRAAGQRARQLGHRLGRDGRRPPRLRVPPRPSVDRRRRRAARRARCVRRRRLGSASPGVGGGAVRGDARRRAQRRRRPGRPGRPRRPDRPGRPGGQAHHLGLRPRRRRRQAPGEGRSVPHVPRLRTDADVHPPPAGRARGVPHAAGGSGRRHRTGGRRGRAGRPVGRRRARLPAAGREPAVGDGGRR